MHARFLERIPLVAWNIVKRCNECKHISGKLSAEVACVRNFKAGGGRVREEECGDKGEGSQ